jgi:catechol 2,3-dioxygenase-like lactoylglutathione lyase family enzyme
MDDISAARDQNRNEMAKDASTAHPAKYTGKSPIQVNKLGHLVYEVSDLDRSLRFWTEVMGFKISDRNAKGMVFLRCNADHHGIGIRQSPKGKRPDRDAGMQVSHLALEVANTDVLIKARDYLKANGIPVVGEGRKGAGCNIAVSFLDPDGYEFELYCNMDQIDASGRTRPESQFRPAATIEESVANPVPEKW